MARFKSDRSTTFKRRDSPDNFAGGRSERPSSRFRDREDRPEGGRGERSGGGRFGRGGFGGGRDGGRGGGFDRPRKPLELHKVICDACGIETEVPFKPTSSKPIYCRDCFNKNEGRSSDGRSDSRPRDGPRDFPRTDSGAGSKLQNEQIAEINKKLDKIMEALDLK